MLELIQSTLKEFEVYAHEHLGDASAPWTKEIMTRLCQAGQDESCTVCVTSIDEADYGEWLYDMTWLKYNGKRLENVELVLECEWGYFDQDVRDDFQKLLLAKARLRCMIFWAEDRETGTDNVNTLIEEIELFQRSAIGDTYLFCVWSDDTNGFDFWTHTFDPNTKRP